MVCWDALFDEGRSSAGMANAALVAERLPTVHRTRTWSLRVPPLKTDVSNVCSLSNCLMIDGRFGFYILHKKKRQTNTRIAVVGPVSLILRQQQRRKKKCHKKWLLDSSFH